MNTLTQLREVNFLRNLIASSELDGAEYYMKRGAYVAALKRANYVLTNIPNSTEKNRALTIMHDAYKTWILRIRTKSSRTKTGKLR